MNTAGIKPRDIIEVTTKSEKGYALVETVTQRGRSREFGYVPIGGDWQPGRFHRPPAKATQISGWWSKRARDDISPALPALPPRGLARADPDLRVVPHHLAPIHRQDEAKGQAAWQQRLMT